MTELLLHRHDVSQSLARVVHVVFHVDDGNLGPLGELSDDQIALAIQPSRRFAVDSNRDGVTHLGQNTGDIADSLGGVGDFLTFQCRGVDCSGLEKVSVPAELGHSGFEGITRPERRIVEQHMQRLTIEHSMRLTSDELPLQIMGRVEHRFNLISGEIEPCEEISSSKRCVGHSLSSLADRLYVRRKLVLRDGRSRTTLQCIDRSI